MLNRYPNVFRNKWDCLHHLFMVTGNGYRWNKGELVYNYEEGVVDTSEHEKENEMEYIEDFIYPISKYSFIVDAPEKGNQDWKNGATEMKT